MTRIPDEAERAVVKKALHVPAHYEIPCHIALGYPANDKRTRQVTIALAERIHTNVW